MPGEYDVEPPSLDECDPTVALDDLPTIGATWLHRQQATYAGRVLIALSARAGGPFELSVVGPVDLSVGDYPPAVERFSLGDIDERSTPAWGNAFSPRFGCDGGQPIDAADSIKFAVRVVHPGGVPELELRQVAVYTRGRALLVAEKLVTASAWTPRMRIDFPLATTIVAMNPGWH